MQFTGNLSLQTLDLPPSAEWPVSPPGWCVIRLSRGMGYCLGRERALEIATGELLTVPPETPVIFRASELGPVQLHYFHFQPRLLEGLFTLPEQKQFSALAASPGPEAARLPASHPVAVQLAGLCENPDREIPLAERCRILTLAVALFTPSLTALTAPPHSETVARSRFLELTRRLPEAELLKHSPDELAGQCRCGVRHFTRLFRAEFGVSFRARQTRSRLEHARRLLAQGDMEVAAVARAVGYESPRVFASQFKKEFGVTPSQWLRAGTEDSKISVL